MRGCIADFFTYETTKSVVVKSWLVGVINRVVQLLIIIYFVGILASGSMAVFSQVVLTNYVFLYEKAYQNRDTGIESAVMTKVKGFGSLEGDIMDVADYVAPQQGSSVFCIITRQIVTENQMQGKCAETEKNFYCTTDNDCVKHLHSIKANGNVTGKCLSPENKCEINGWCPAEKDTDESKPEIMEEVENFTIFIKNSIRFPLFNVTRGNFPPNMDKEYISNCTFDPIHHPACPIFRVGDILRFSNEEFKDIAKRGGEIGISISWKCNLDLPLKYCTPKYSFTRLDEVFEDSNISKGYNFRYAKYYKTENGTDFRTLHKAFAIRFDILVTGTAGKFNLVPTLINIVAALTSVGLGTVLCDYILLNFIKGAEQYKEKKFEEVSTVQN